MNTNEWPLILFTLLSQISVGMTLTTLIVSVLFRKPTDSFPLRRMKAVTLTATLLMGMALLLSFLHLGQPGRSIYALGGIGTSWLSREILLAPLFFGMLAAHYLSIRFQLLKHELQSLWMFLTAFIGIFLIYSMIRIYMLPTIPAWSHIGTPIAFFNTALMLGPAFILALRLFNASHGIESKASATVDRYLVITILAGIIIHLINQSFLVPGNIAPQTVFVPEMVPALWDAGRWFLLLAGLAAIIVWMAISYKKTSYGNAWLVYLACTALLLAELIARYQFYASYYRIGI